MARGKTFAGLIALIMCGCGGQARVVIGAKNFAEQLVLGEILSQHVERRLGISVDRRLNLGGTLLAHEALVAGEIDLYPEYSGTALTAILHASPTVDSAEVFTFVKKEYARRWDITWFPSLGFENTFAMVVSGEVARTAQIETLSDAVKLPRTWRLGAGYEFTQRPDGLEGLLKVYPFNLAGPPASMDLGLLYQALLSGQVDMIAANSTDGLLSAVDAVVLRDDKSYFPPYQCAVIARQAALLKHPGLRETLLQLSGAISDDLMRRLNYEVSAKHVPVSIVAARFLEERFPEQGRPRRH